MSAYLPEGPSKFTTVRSAFPGRQDERQVVGQHEVAFTNRFAGSEKMTDSPHVGPGLRLQDVFGVLEPPGKNTGPIFRSKHIFRNFRPFKTIGHEGGLDVLGPDVRGEVMLPGRHAILETESPAFGLSPNSRDQALVAPPDAHPQAEGGCVRDDNLVAPRSTVVRAEER